MTNLNKDIFLSKRIFYYQIFGFFSVLIVIWLDEVIDLPYLLSLSGKTPINFAESIIETIIILFLSFFIISISHKAIKKIKNILHYYIQVTKMIF